MANKKLIIKADCSDYILNSGCNYCFIELTPDVLSMYDKCFKLFDSIKEDDENILSLYYVCKNSLYLSWSEKLGELKLSDGIKLKDQIGQGYCFLPWNFNPEKHDHGLSKNEQFIISEEGLSFFAHTSDECFIETETIPRALLK